MDEPTKQEREFDFEMERCGVVVPADRRQGAIAGYLELKRMAGLLRQPREPESEPANIFSMQAILRGE